MSLPASKGTKILPPPVCWLRLTFQSRDTKQLIAFGRTCADAAKKTRLDISCLFDMQKEMIEEGDKTQSVSPPLY